MSLQPAISLALILAMLASFASPVIAGIHTCSGAEGASAHTAELHGHAHDHDHHHDHHVHHAADDAVEHDHHRHASVGHDCPDSPIDQIRPPICCIDGADAGSMMLPQAAISTVKPLELVRIAVCLVALDERLRQLVLIEPVPCRIGHSPPYLAPLRSHTWLHTASLLI